MRLFLRQEEYFSVEEYAEALAQYVAEHNLPNIAIRVYNTDEDRVRGVNAIAGFVPSSFDKKTFINGVRYLEEMAW